MDDVKIIYDKFRNHSLSSDIGEGLVKMGRIPKEVLKKENAKIDETMMKEYYLTDDYISTASALGIATKIDYLKIYQSILSKQLPPERYQGIVNVLYINFNPNATTEEIESALAYLYGTDAAATKTSFVSKFPNLKSTDCTYTWHAYKVDQAKTFLKEPSNYIKPKVLQDFMAIYDKFPCSFRALYSLEIFLHLHKRYQSNDSKIDACKIKANPGTYERDSENTRDNAEREIYEIESTMSTRLTDETYSRIINFLRVTIPDTPIDEIEKALEYLYDDVPKAKCPEKGSAKLETE